MVNATLQKRIAKIEAELKLIKREISERPDFAIDEKNWRKMRPVMKKVRAQVYKARYG